MAQPIQKLIVKFVSFSISAPDQVARRKCRDRGVGRRFSLVQRPFPFQRRPRFEIGVEPEGFGRRRRLPQSPQDRAVMEGHEKTRRMLARADH